MRNNLSYCAKIVKDRDPDRFLLTMLMPAQFHEDMLALFAFNYEIAKTREVVNETVLGQMRLQWWREELDKVYSGKAHAQNETLSALKAAIESRALPQDHFEMLLHAREFDLEDVMPSNMEGFLNYCDFTVSPLLKLVLCVMGDDPEGEPVQPVAINQALTGLMRALPFHAQQRRCYLPEGLVKEHGQSMNKLYEMKPADDLSKVVEACMEYFTGDLKLENRFLRATQKLSSIYAKQIKASKYNMFLPKMGLEPPFKALRLLIATKF